MSRTLAEEGWESSSSASALSISGWPDPSRSELAAPLDPPVYCRHRDVETLLRIEARNHGEERPLFQRKARFLLKGRLVCRAAGERLDVVARGERGVRGGIPEVGVDSVQDSRQPILARPKNAVQSVAPSGVRISRA